MCMKSQFYFWNRICRFRIALATYLLHRMHSFFPRGFFSTGMWDNRYAGNECRHLPVMFTEWAWVKAECKERRPISLESVRDVATYQRFAFLTAITGVTSFVLFGMTVMANDKMNLNLQVTGSASRYIAWTLDGALCRPYHSFITIVRIWTPWSTLAFDFWLLCFRSSQSGFKTYRPNLRL